MRTLCSLIRGILAGAFLTSGAAAQDGWEALKLFRDQDPAVRVCSKRSDDHICLLVWCHRPGSLILEFDTSTLHVGNSRLVIDANSFPILVVDQPPRFFEFGIRAESIPAGLIDALKTGKALTLEGTPESGVRVSIPLKNAATVLKRLEQQFPGMTVRKPANDAGPPAVKAPTAARLQALPQQLRNEVERIRHECTALYPAFAPSTEMQGLHFIKLEDRPAILVDNLGLCNDHVPGVNCSNRGCDVSIWRQDNSGAWHNVFKEHLYAKTIHIDQPSGRLQSMEMDLHAGHAWCKPKPGKIYMSSESCHIVIRYTGAKWSAQRVPPGRPKTQTSR